MFEYCDKLVLVTLNQCSAIHDHFNTYQEILLLLDVIVFTIVVAGFMAGRADGVLVIVVVVGEILRRSIT